MVVYMPHPSLKGRIGLWDNLYFYHGQKLKEQTKFFKIWGSKKANLLLTVFEHLEIWGLQQVHCEFNIASRMQAQTQIQVPDQEHWVVLGDQLKTLQFLKTLHLPCESQGPEKHLNHPYCDIQNHLCK